MSEDLYANAIVMKTMPIIMKTKNPVNGNGKPMLDANGKPVNGNPVNGNPMLDANGNPVNGNGKPMLDANEKPMLDANGKPMLDANGNPVSGSGNGNGNGNGKPASTDSEDHKKILEKEKIIEDLLRQYNQHATSAVANGSSTAEETQNQNIAVDFFLKMVKTYFALIFKFGDTVANSVIRITMPAQIADPIISNTPLNVADLVKTADRVNQVLANPEFKTELGQMFDNTSNAVNPQIKMLLNKMADIITDVAGKTGSKLASTAAISLSAFPPLAVAFDIANLISVGINAASSGINMVSTAANSGANVVTAFNSTPSIDMNKHMANTTEKKVVGSSVSSKVAVDNKTTTTTQNKTKKLSGGGLKEAGTQFLHDIGGDFILTAGEKVQNAYYNVSDTILPEIDKFKLKVMRYTLSRENFKRQVGGAKKTKRSIARIRKTLRSFA